MFSSLEAFLRRCVHENGTDRLQTERQNKRQQQRKTTGRKRPEIETQINVGGRLWFGYFYAAPAAEVDILHADINCGY